MRTAGPWWRRSRAVTFQEALGPTVVHHVDVEIGGERTRAPEIFEAYDAERGAFPTKAHDDRGGVETSIAVLRNGVWTSRANGIAFDVALLVLGGRRSPV